MQHAALMTDSPSALPDVITDAFRAARESVRNWAPSRADDGSLDPDVRAITDEINDLHRAVDRRLAELGGEPVASPPGGPLVGRVFQLNAIVTLQEAHDLSRAATSSYLLLVTRSRSCRGSSVRGSPGGLSRATRQRP